MKKLVLALGFVACSAVEQIDSIESAEKAITAGGVVLSERTENTSQHVAPRAFMYRTDSGALLGIMQFQNPEAARNWANLIESLPTPALVTTSGNVGFMIPPHGTDHSRQQLYELLRSLR